MEEHIKGRIGRGRDVISAADVRIYAQRLVQMYFIINSTVLYISRDALVLIKYSCHTGQNS